MSRLVDGSQPALQLKAAAGDPVRTGVRAGYLRIVAGGLMAGGLAAWFMPLFILNLGDRYYNLSGWRMLLSAIAWQGHVVQHAWFVRLIMVGILLEIGRAHV